MAGIAVVTGAFSFTGSAVARSLIARGYRVRTLTNRREPLFDPGEAIETHPLQFEDRHALAAAMTGADIFVNTYWVRYPYVGVGFDKAVENSNALCRAAAEAGVRRQVLVSVSNPSLDSPLAYYRGKAQAEEGLKALGVSYAIVRPTLIVGPKDILTANIGWFLRRFPLFLMPGDGAYRLEPVTLEDTGEIVADAALADGDMTVDAAGPEVYTFADFASTVAGAMGVRRPVLRVPPWFAVAVLRLVGFAVGEVILSREELEELRTELLLSHEPPRGQQSVRAWLNQHGNEIGRSYVSEFERHVRPR
jgi:NADH dehydrogenase